MSSRRVSLRDSYDEVAEEYSARLGGELAYKPLDRALLSALIEQTPPGSPIADLGCGPGHVAAWLARDRGQVVGIDLSPGMVAVGRREHPEVDFRLGDLLSLPARDAEFGAAVALYSIIHLESGELEAAFREVSRTLQPGGLFLVSFHIGSELRHIAEWWGHQVDLDFCFYEPGIVIGCLEKAGFVIEARLERASHPEEVETRRGYVLARRPLE